MRTASPIVQSILALILLIAATVLGVYKPFGMTPYGAARTRGAQRQAVTSATLTSSFRVIDARTPAPWTYLFGIIAIGIVLLFVLLNVLRGVLPGH